MNFPSGSAGKETACTAGDKGFKFWVEKTARRITWQNTPEVLPGKSQGQRSLVGYSPRGHKESDTTERPSMWGSSIHGPGRSVCKDCFFFFGQDLTRAPYSLLQWPNQVVDRFDKAL